MSRWDFVPTPPLSATYVSEYESKIRDQETRAHVHPLEFIYPCELRKDSKPLGKNPPSRMDMKRKPKINALQTES